VLDLGGMSLELIHTPGHTMGSLCIYERGQGILFTGDHILGAGTTSINPEHGDMALYIASLQKLLKYNAKAIYPGHGPVIKEPNTKINELVQHRMDREKQVIELLRAGKGTVEAMLKAIYPELDKRLEGMAKGQIQAHIHKLEKEGRVGQRDGTYFLK